MKTGDRVEIEVRRLRPEDDRSGFSSGNADLDRFFRQYAGQNQFRHHIGTTFVAIADGVILGFFTVAASELTAARLPAANRKRLPLYPLPVLRLARLAVDERAQGRGIGVSAARYCAPCLLSRTGWPTTSAVPAWWWTPSPKPWRLREARLHDARCSNRGIRPAFDVPRARRDSEAARVIAVTRTGRGGSRRRRT